MPYPQLATESRFFCHNEIGLDLQGMAFVLVPG